MQEFYRHKKILVYGASGGLGQALCLQLHGQVAGLVLAGRSKDKLRNLQAKLETNTNPATGQATPTQSKLEVWAFPAGSEAKLAAQVCRAGVDGVIVASGRTVYRPFCRQSHNDSQPLWADYEQILGVNLNGVLHLALELLPYLQQRGGFYHIAGSYASIFPVPYQAVYSASKAALLSFVQAVDAELRSEKRARGLLSISLIGGMATAMYYQSDLQRQFGRYHLLERLLISPPDKVARALLRGIAKQKQVIAVGPAGFWLYHLVRRLPSSLIGQVLGRAYRPVKSPRKRTPRSAQSNS